jgi:hypothetical protein
LFNRGLTCLQKLMTFYLNFPYTRVILKGYQFAALILLVLGFSSLTGTTPMQITAYLLIGALIEVLVLTIIVLGQKEKSP